MAIPKCFSIARHSTSEKEVVGKRDCHTSRRYTMQVGAKRSRRAAIVGWLARRTRLAERKLTRVIQLFSKSRSRRY